MTTKSSEPSSSSSLEIPRGQRSRSSARLREKNVMFEVLDNPSLREEILKHAIRGNDGKVDRRTAFTLRLVDRSWDESVLRILWKAHEPLFRVIPGTAAPKTFDISSRSIIGPPPPLKLDGFWQLYEWSQVQNFSNFLTNCGPALVHLGIEIFDFGVPLTTPLPEWSLSRLHKLKLSVSLRRKVGVEWRPMGDGGRQRVEVASQQDKLSERLAKSILRGATALAELNLIISQRSFGNPMFQNVAFFESLTLPPSLVQLNVRMEMGEGPSRAFLEALARSPPPNLTSLSLSTGNALAREQFFGVMNKFKSCLKHLVIVEDYHGPPRILNVTRFPVMEQLEELSITSITAELESGMEPLGRRFPKLRILGLRHHTLGMFRKWVESSIFTGVTSLELLLVDENVRESDTDNFLVSVNMEVMQLVNGAFPNLRKLDMGISKRDVSGLEYIFTEMRQLVELKLRVFDDDLTTDVWDSILTGIPAEMITRAILQGPGFLENRRQNLVSINNLQELKSFSVIDNRDLHDRFVERHFNYDSLISDFLFEHAFLQMPNLTHLHFEGPFKVSRRMTERWIREQRRSLVYLRFVDSLV